MALAQQNIIERRLFNRHLVNARVQLVHGTIGNVTARTRDISDSGIFVEVYPVPKLPNGSHIKLHMMDSAQPAIAFNMKVVRSTSQGIGLMFIDYELDGERFPINTLRELFKRK